MTEYIVIFWVPSDRVFNSKSFESHEESIQFANRKQKSDRCDVVIVKSINGKYHLTDFGYSKVYVWQNRIFNLLSVMLIAIISYLYYKFFTKK
jgi:hypothetical protein